MPDPVSLEGDCQFQSNKFLLGPLVLKTVGHTVPLRYLYQNYLLNTLLLISLLHALLHDALSPGPICCGPLNRAENLTPSLSPKVPCCSAL
jgi:hypothetical protein